MYILDTSEIHNDELKMFVSHNGTHLRIAKQSKSLNLANAVANFSCLKHNLSAGLHIALKAMITKGCPTACNNSSGTTSCKHSRNRKIQ